jgi:hypothetical protein
MEGQFSGMLTYRQFKIDVPWSHLLEEGHTAGHRVNVDALPTFQIEKVSVRKTRWMVCPNINIKASIPLFKYTRKNEIFTFLRISMG